MINKFDELAATWDADPKRVERSRKAFEFLQKHVNLDKNQKCLDFGCATGTLSFFISPFVNSGTLVDSSTEMLKVVNEKISTLEVANLSTSNIDLVNLESTNIKPEYDIIYTLMALHHVQNYSKLISNFAQLLNPGGLLFIGDLVTEDGTFHDFDPNFDGINGFDKEELVEICNRYNLSLIAYEEFLNIEKNGKNYPVFGLIVKKL